MIVATAINGKVGDADGTRSPSPRQPSSAILRATRRRASPTWFTAERASSTGRAIPAGKRRTATRGTPGVTHLDALGRTFLTMEGNGAAGAYSTRLKLDLDGNLLDWIANHPLYKDIPKGPIGK
jgi:hypothetical protein